jgi:tRNA 2-thiouridine synthesizing protein A
MTTHTLDALGLKCPQPVLKVAILARQMQSGDLLEIVADCESFPEDIDKWCKQTGNTLLFCADEGGGKVKAQIQF